MNRQRKNCCSFDTMKTLMPSILNAASVAVIASLLFLPVQSQPYLSEFKVCSIVVRCVSDRDSCWHRILPCAV